MNQIFFLDIMSLKFQFEQIFLSDFNGQEMYSNLKYKLDNNLKLEENDILKLIILPLAQNEDRQKAIENTIELTKQIPDEGNKSFALAGIIAATNKFINEENLSMIRRELDMTPFGRLIEEEKIDYGNKIAKDVAEEKEKEKEQAIKQKELEKEQAIKQKEIEKKEAIEENKKKINKEITKNLLSMGIDILSIMKATGLTKAEVLKIQKELN